MLLIGAVVVAFNGGGAAAVIGVDVAIDWLDVGGVGGTAEDDLVCAMGAGICWFVIGGGNDIGFTAAPIVGGGSCGGGAAAVDAGTFDGAYKFGRWFDVGVGFGGK